MSQFVSNPTQDHLNHALYIFQYLQGTKEKGIAYRRKKEYSIEAYCDADWASDKNDQKSTTGMSQHSSPETDNQPPTPTPTANTASPSVPVDKFVSYIWVFNNFESWAALRWQASSDHECLWLLSKVFRDVEQDIINAMKTQVEMVLLAHKMYGPPLLLSFDTFLDQTITKELVMQDALSAENTPTWEDICPAPLVDLSTPTSSTTSSSLNSEPEPQFQFWIRALCRPSIPRSPLPDNSIPAHTLHDLTYVQMAAAMTDKIVALTGNAHRQWVHFFMAIKDDPVNWHLYNTTASLCPILDKAFYPTPTTPALHYYLSGKMDIPESHLFFSYWCFNCNCLGHWRWEHNKQRPY
ncbi:hypothetical protein V8B97DRAFT_2009505 [Scleroderma yunnanense]